jgi:pteridine reductase
MTMQLLQGKVALVTGSARRIGAVTVRALHQQGATVVVHYRNSANDAKALCDELNAMRENSCLIQQAELADIDSLQSMIDQIISKTGRLDILINNASSFYPTKVGEIKESDWDNLMASNLKAPLFLSQAATPHLKKVQGCIVNMVDIHSERPLKDHAVYCSAKAGLAMLTKSLAKELGPDIRVNGVSPGAILWPEDDDDSPEMKAQHQSILDKTSLNKTGSAEDIANTIMFLVTQADYITGHIIPVDGGRLLNQ